MTSETWAPRQLSLVAYLETWARMSGMTSSSVVAGCSSIFVLPRADSVVEGGGGGDSFASSPLPASTTSSAACPSRYARFVERGPSFDREAALSRPSDLERRDEKDSVIGPRLRRRVVFGVGGQKALMMTTTQKKKSDLG